MSADGIVYTEKCATYITDIFYQVVVDNEMSL